MNSLERLWRLIGTAASFLLFGLGGVLLGIFVFPPVALLVRDQSRRARLARNIVSASFRLYIDIMRFLGVLSYTIDGRENIVDTHRCLIAANHPSLLDVVFLIALFKDADCVVKRGMWSNPFTAITVRTTGYIPNHDPEFVIQKCVQRLLDGSSLILFPEGTRSLPGQSLTFKRGAASIATRAEATVVPVRIRCTPATLTKGEPWYRIPSQKPHFEIKVLPGLATRPFLADTKSERQASIILNEHLISILT